MSTTNGDPILTRDRAICMFFYVEFNEENVKKCKEKLEEIDQAEMCWNVDPRQPILVSKARICEDPFTYRKYDAPTST
jgi:hypothetical protein